MDLFQDENDKRFHLIINTDHTVKKSLIELIIRFNKLDTKIKASVDEQVPINKSFKYKIMRKIIIEDRKDVNSVINKLKNLPGDVLWKDRAY